MRLLPLFLSLAISASPVYPADALFDDPIAARASTFTIRESDVQAAYEGHKAAAAATGQNPPDALKGTLKEQILENLLATKLLLAKATPLDREEGKLMADRIILSSRERAGSEATYHRRIYAVGSTPEKFEAEMFEQAIVQAVIDRELRKKEIVSDAEVRKYYNDHLDQYQEPERARVLHILFATREIPSGKPFSLEQRLARKAAAEQAAARARAGEDFSRLIVELSDDPDAKEKKGELAFTRGKGTVPPQFEAAALSLQPGQVSAPVSSVFGYHLIKMIEKIPALQIPFDRVEGQIRAALQREAVQKQLPAFLERLKKEAQVEILAR